MRKSLLVSPYILLTVGVIAVSFSAILVKWSTAPASIIGMYRMLLTVPVLLLFGMGRSVSKAKAELDRKDWSRLFFSGIFLALHFLLWMESLKLTSVASSTVILTLQPAFTMLGTFLFYHLKTNTGQLSSLLVAVAGSVIIAWGDIGISAQAVLGDFCSFLGAAAYAVHLLFGQSLMKKMSGAPYSFIVFCIAGMCLLIYNVSAGIEIFHYSLKNWAAFLLLAVVSTVLGHMLFNISLKYVDATKITMLVVAEPVIATLLAWGLFGEAVGAIQMIGGLVTLAGIAIYFLNPSEKRSVIKTRKL